MKKSFKHLMASVVASALAIGTLSAVAYADDVNKHVDTWGYLDASGKNVVTASLADALANAKDNDITYTVYTNIPGTDEDTKMIYTVKNLGDVEGYKQGITVKLDDYTCTLDGSKTFTVAVGDNKAFMQDKVVLPKGHRASDPIEMAKKDSTCTEEGTAHYVVKCTACGTKLDEYDKVIDIKNHVAKEASKVQIKANELNYVDKDGKEVVVPVRQDPTCEAEGWYYVGQHCSLCGVVIPSSLETKKVDSLSKQATATNKEAVAGYHNWEYDETLNGKKASCEEVGIKYFVCKNEGKDENGNIVKCGNVQGFYTPATGHTEIKIYRHVDPTCTNPGSDTTIYKCGTCGKELKNRSEVVIPATGHKADTEYYNYIVKYGKPAVISENAPKNCLEKGTYVQVTYCSVCKTEISRETKTGTAGPHSPKTDKDGYNGLLWEKEEVVLPGCLTDGSHIEVNRCSVCNEVLARRTDLEDEKTHKIIDKALGHAVKYFYDEETKSLVDYNVEDYVAPTCEKSGSWTEVHYCKRCGIVLENETINGVTYKTVKHSVDAYQHSDNKGNSAFTVCVYYVKKPTCTEAGAGYFQCSLCGALEQDTTSSNKYRSRVIPALGHDLEGVEIVKDVVKPATCTTAGQARYIQTCKRCAQPVCAMPLKDSKGNIIKDTNGNPILCGAVFNDKHTCYENIPAFGHKYGDAEMVVKSDLCKIDAKLHKAPTCTEAGVVDYVKTCSICGTKDFEHKAVKALGHLYPTVDQIRQQVAEGVAYIAKEPTCTTNGYGHVKCVRCNGDVYDWQLWYGDKEYFEDGVLPAYGHDYAQVIITGNAAYAAVEPTCTARGMHYEGFVCTRCGAIFTTYSTDAETAKKQKEAGLKAPWSVSDAPLGHAYTAENAKVVMDKDDPMKGVVEFKCSRKLCPSTIAVIKEFKFTDADIVVDTASTCTVTGTGHYEVKVYADEDDYYVVKSSSIVVPVAAHVSSVPNTVIENEVKATATTEGKFDVVDYCVKCGAEINRITYTVDPTGAVENPYKDVKNNAYYTDAIVELYDRGIMTGTAPETFGFNKNLERQDLVTLLYRLDGEEAVSAKNAFADVKAGKYYTNAVLWAQENGIVTGYTKGDKAGKFGVGDKITRQDFVVILYRYANSNGLDISANADDSYLAKEDASSVSSYAKAAMNWGYENGLIGSGSNLRPLETITRQDAATIIARFLNLYNI